ncbi:MAG: glycoside hydrolase family 3 C-terminal domain-containing protein, partial [bacterium]|nr:glycoside hydrolase family 3 C-terminal domain-containing protein [bacterium]
MELQQYEKEHIETLRKYCPECTVLLKKNGEFPIANPCRVALYGSGARRTLKGGTGSGDVYSRFYTTAEAGLESAGFTVTTKDWLDKYDAFADARHREFARKLRLKIKRAGKEGMQLYGTGAIDSETEYEFPTDHDGDICVYVLARLSGEGWDREPKKGDLFLTDGEIRDILKLNKKFKKFILVLNVSGVVDLTPVKDVGNILLLSQLGIPTGDVLADIILGKSEPSGRLTTTWTTYSDYQTIGQFGERDDTRYNEGIYVGYRYFDTVGKTPLFPFGYGLSYTEFDVKFAGISNDGGKITVKAEVKNTGKRAGREVVQVYLSCPWGRFDKPAKELSAHGKTTLLESGGSETVEMVF